MIHNLIFNYKKIYNLFALKKFKIIEKNAQNRQIEKSLRVRKNLTRTLLLSKKYLTIQKSFL